MKKANVHRLRGLDSRGATFAEFALVIPILLFFVLAIIEVGRYLTIRGIISSAADRMATLLASDPGMQDWEAGKSWDQQKQSVQQARTNAMRQFEMIAYSSMISDDPTSARLAYVDPPVITGPTPNTGESLSQAFENRPIQVSVTAHITPLFPCLASLLDFEHGGDCKTTFTANIQANTFREPMKVLTMPLVTDCKGRPQGSPDYYRDCPCDPSKYWDRTSRSCVCYTQDSNNDGLCDCDDHYQLSEDGKSCNCVIQNSECPGTGMTASTSSCSCACDSGRGFTQQGDGCGCEGTKVLLGDSCGCDPSIVCDPAQGLVLDTDSCSCVCNASAGFGGDPSSCACSAAKKIVQNNACVCDQSIVCDNGKGQTMDPQTCDCKCPSSYGNQEWYCNYYGGNWDPTTCSCNCGTGKSWTDYGTYGFCTCADVNQYMDYNSPGKPCICYSDREMESDGSGGCKCKDDAKSIQGTWCACDNLGQPCADPSQVVDYVNCQCSCVPQS